MSAVSVKFYLESRIKGDKKKPLPIFLYIRHQGRTLKVYTERKCNWHAWDVLKGRANPKKFNTATEINDFLSDLETEGTNLYNYNLRKGIVTGKSDIVKLIAELSGKDIKNLNLIEFANDFLKSAKLAPNTRKSYQTTLNILEEYSQKKRRLLDFKDIDLNFYDSFTTYMWKDKKFNDNTVGKNIKNIKSLMNQAFERDLHSNLNHRKKGFKVLRKESDAIYLTEGELKKILNADLSNLPGVSQARDIFIVACWTGLRFSDLVRVSKDKFVVEDGINIFRIESQKTGEIVKIPIKPEILPILKKYDFQLPVISNQKLNDHLKTLGEKAKLEQEIEVSENKGGEKTRAKFAKHQLITTHTARRSFATNLYLQGVDARSIMAVTGHKTEKAFLIYLKLSNLQKVRNIHDHFKTTSKKK
jgi:integrase